VGARYLCVVCGRSFPEGQGIIVEKAGHRLFFHSKRCLTRFFRRFVEELEDSCASRAISRVKSEFEELAKAREKAKVI